MSLPSSGSISMAQVRSELGESGSISLGQTSVRNLAGVSSGAISMSDLRGKSNWDGSVSDATDVSSSNSSLTYTLAELIFHSDGRIERRTESTALDIGNWDGSVANSSNSEIQFSIISQGTNNSNVNNSASSYSSLSSVKAINISSTNTSGLSNWIDVKIRLRKTGDSSSEVTKDVRLSIMAGSPF